MEDHGPIRDEARGTPVVEGAKSVVGGNGAAMVEGTAVVAGECPISLLPRKSKKLPPRLDAIGTARFAASVHVVCGHLVNRTPSEGYPWPTSAWGFTWVPWFMMLSAFILTFAKVSKPGSKPDGIFLFMAKRLRGIYPLYISGLIAAAAVDALEGKRAMTLGTPLETVASLFLLQAWIPTVTEHVYQTQCWFLSAIIPLWIIHEMVLERVKNWSEWKLWTLMGVFTVLPWFGLVALPPMIGEPMDWYKDHDPERRNMTLLDYWVVLLKFNPIFFVTTYFYGMVSAIIFVRYRENPPFIFRYGATLAYVALYLIFGLSGTLFPARKLSARLGALAPLHALLLIGLSVGADPLVQLMGHKYLSWCGDLSFPQYVMQFIAMAIWDGFGNAGLFAFLLLLAVISFLWVYQPLHDMDSPWRTQALGLIGILAIPLLCVGLQAAKEMSVVGPPQERLPGFKWYSQDMIDYRLNLSSAQRIPGLDSVYGSLINPSLLYHDGKLHIAVRQHYFTVTSTKGTFPTRDSTNFNVTAVEKVTQRWYSYLYTGILNADTLQQEGTLKPFTPAPPHSSYSAWTPCLSPPTYVPGNRSISLVESVGGMEDPRLLLRTNATTRVTALGLTFYSNMPRDLKLEEEGTAPGPPYGTFYAKVWGERPLEGLCPSKGRVWITNIRGESYYAPPQATGLERQMGLLFEAEKNWMFFESDGLQRFVTDVEPHTIYDVTTRSPENELIRAAMETNPRLAEAVTKNGAKIHGGANPIRVTSDIFLGSFHTITAGGVYANFLYEFYAHPPYSVIRISSPLPLLAAPLRDGSISNPMAFSSGLTELPDKRVLISYGSSNSESRVLVLTAHGVEALFNGSDRSLMPVKCVGAWGPWSACHILSDGECGKESTFTISVLEARGGEPCPARHREVKTQSCVDCGSPSSICTLPRDTTGYNTSHCNDTGLGIRKSSCSITCAAGFHGTAEVRCEELSPFSLAGCAPDACTVPNASSSLSSAAYNFTNCQDWNGDNEIDISECFVSCAFGVVGYPTVTCPAHTAVFHVAGCYVNTTGII
jgi:peptidoglycan/LPS O-acetylase OafA/YrhL